MSRGLAGQAVADSAIALIDLGAGKVTRLVGGNGRFPRRLSPDMRVEGAGCNFLFEWQRTIRGRHRRASRCEVEPDSAEHQQDAQANHHEKAFDHAIPPKLPLLRQFPRRIKHRERREHRKETGTPARLVRWTGGTADKTGQDKGTSSGSGVCVAEEAQQPASRTGAKE